jgi:hypothetical protein
MDQVSTNELHKIADQNPTQTFDNVEHVNFLLDSLCTTERMIVEMIYGLTGDCPKSDIEVARLLRKPRVFISLTHAFALESLRERHSATMARAG